MQLGERRIWGDLPFDSHNIFIPVICNDVPVLDYSYVSDRLVSHRIVLQAIFI